ncbi:MAG: 3,4-dihydroxy-2-butanone-4-phosphate synthase [Methanobacteriota archaeon]
MNDAVKGAVSDLLAGRFVLVYDADGREEETDFMVLARLAKPNHVRTMRKEGGGLIFLMAHHDVCEKFKLPFMTQLYASAGHEHPVLGVLDPNDIPYDTKSSFSLTLNHRRTFTGITDIDRALTISRFGELAAETTGGTSDDAVAKLGKEFRSPGHVAVCRSSASPLKDRFGHTELGTALAVMAGETAVVAGCEMMGDSGKSLPRKDAKAYAERNGFRFLDGSEIVEAWRNWSG